MAREYLGNAPSLCLAARAALALAAADEGAAEAFLRQLSLSDADTDAPLELVYNEILLREQLGETSREEEYLARFRDLASRLGPLFEVLRASKRAVRSIDSLVPEARDDNGREERLGPHGPSAAERLAHPGYSLVRELGRGGLGLVSLAHDPRAPSRSRRQGYWCPGLLVSVRFSLRGLLGGYWCQFVFRWGALLRCRCVSSFFAEGVIGVMVSGGYWCQFVFR